MSQINQPFNIIKKTDVVGDIIESVKQALLGGDLSPGERLPSEADLVEQLGVGRGAVREAMKMLSGLGVIDIRRGDGTYIVDKPSSELLNPLVFAILLEQGTNRELFELRTLIEVGYCQLAAQNATEEDLSQIQKAAQTWERYALSADPDTDQITLFDLDFHFTILDASHNPLVIRIGRTVEELFLNSIRNILSKKEVLEWGVKGHQRIVEALQSRDLEAVRQAVVFSLEYWGGELDKKSHSPLA